MAENTNSLFDATDDGQDVLAGVLAASEHVGSLESLDSIDVDYSARKNRRSFKYSEVDLDNKDFDLPELSQDELPTLESILNEPEEEVFIPEQVNGDDDTHQESRLSPASLGLPELQKTPKMSVNGSVLRHVVLKRISGQMIDACARRDAGLPTAMAASNVVAIGTSHGLVLVFEPRDQALKLILGTTSNGAIYGAVTALCINNDCTRLLCGHAKGQITMWDLSNGNCIRVITDAHPADYAVLHLQFTDDPTLAMCNDSSGSVYCLNFRRIITRTCESLCFFSGSRGEVCAMAPLHLHAGMKDSAFFETSLLAMASLTKVIIVNLKPTPTPLFTARLPGPKDSLPLLSWQFAVVQREHIAKQLCPVLAFARDRTVHFYQVWKSGNDFKFSSFQTIETDYLLIAMHWLSPQVIVTVDTFERIHVIDVRTREELECLDLGSVRLVYGSSYFKSLSTGGNVSKALKAASEYACFQSVQVFNGQLLLLGTKSIHCLTLRTWKDRIDFFVKQNMFLEALQLGLSFYDGKAKAVVGLLGNRRKRRHMVADEIVDTLLLYLDIAMSVNCPKTNDSGVLQSYFRTMVPVFVEHCIHINRLDLLFGEIYERFAEDADSQKEFLEGLEEFIMNNKLKYLNPVLMQDFVMHYEETGQLKKLEACLVHLDIAAIDLHHMIKLCWTHSLYNAVIYVYNKGLLDYVTPLEELLRILRAWLRTRKTLTSAESSTGYKVMVYISCCLAGNQYPLGEIDPSLAGKVKEEVFEFLMKKRAVDAIEGDPLYPSLRTLLEFDTREFLNVLSLAYEQPEFNLSERERIIGESSRRQKVVDILLQIMVNDAKFSPADVGTLFTFIARQMAKYERDIKVNKLLFEQVLEYLANPDDDSRHEERQQALLELLNAGGLKQFDNERILALAESAKFFKVAEVLYERKRQFAKVISCYWRDPARRNQTFSYIDSLLTDESVTTLEVEEIKDAVIDTTNDLVAIDSRKFARLILNNFLSSLNTIVEKLESKPDLQYQLLCGVFRSRGENKGKSELPVSDPEIHELFIQLMCKFDPGEVLNYLRTAENYRLEQTLVIVRSYNIVNATAFLLERAGDVQGAFQLLHDDLKSKINNLNKVFVEEGDEEYTRDIKIAQKVTQASLQTLIQMCQRNSPRLESEDRKALWFPLLEIVMAPQRRIRNMASLHFLALKELTKQVLTSMMGYLSLPSVLEKIMQDPAYSTGKFGEIRELVMGMLETYTYEMTLLETTKSLLEGDLHSQYRTEKAVNSRGFAPSYLACGICDSTYVSTHTSTSSNAIVLFRCNHSFHRLCLEASVGYGEELSCVICNKAGSFVVGVAQTSAERADSHYAVSSEPGPSKPSSSARGVKKDEKPVALSLLQETALDRLIRHNREPSRLELLSDLSTQDQHYSRVRSVTGSLVSSRLQSAPNKGLLHGKDFNLKLTPPSVSLT